MDAQGGASIDLEQREHVLHEVEFEKVRRNLLEKCNVHTLIERSRNSQPRI
jgi:hypothetical protein